MLLACGATLVRGDEEHHLRLLELYFQRCGVELLIVDEVEHITHPGLRRRLLELSNLTGVPIVCASCNPIAWTAGDTEVQGRWNDYFELTQFTGPRLDVFLSMLDLLLPFERTLVWVCVRSRTSTTRPRRRVRLTTSNNGPMASYAR